jgi:hypothetical protein
MSFEREYRNGPFVMSCDHCNDTIECEHTEFEDALADAKSRGWLIRKRRDTWMHFCSSSCDEDHLNSLKPRFPKAPV